MRMRVGELSERSGVSVPSIKYYGREGLLPPPELTDRNQGIYDDKHLARLNLIRALRDVGGVGIGTMRAVFACLREPGGTDDPTYLPDALRALSGPANLDMGDADTAEARVLVDDLLAEVGWDVEERSPGWADLVRGVAAVKRFLPGLLEDGSDLEPHARVMRQLAEVEVPEDFDVGGDPEAVLRFALLGTVVFEPVVLALRKLAHVDRQRGLRER